MKLPFLLFDLDNTLYPPSSGVLQDMNRRIGKFCADYFGVDVSVADDMRRDKHMIYGTTLQWLRVCHGLKDPEPYIRAIHPVNIDAYVQADPDLRSFISGIPADYVLFTNSPMEHARRTLKALNLDDLFPRIWDLRRMGYRGKPHRESYERILGDLGLRADEAILIDDNEANISGFKSLGGRVLPVGHIPISQWTKQLIVLMEA